MLLRCCGGSRHVRPEADHNPSSAMQARCFDRNKLNLRIGPQVMANGRLHVELNGVLLAPLLTMTLVGWLCLQLRNSPTFYY